jgi:hypothetical protein
MYNLRFLFNNIKEIDGHFELASIAPLIAIVFDLAMHCRHLTIYLTIYQKDFYMQISEALKIASNAVYLNLSYIWFCII